MSEPSDLSKTAVIIEDDAEIRHLIVEVPEAAGFSTVSVGNGIDGVRAVASYQPLVTTLDVNMPGIDGFEAARRIRAQSDTFIIMITGLEEEADLVVGLGAGADDYIVKPFRPRELRARIDSMLRRPRVTAASLANAVPRQESSGPSFPGSRPAATRVQEFSQVYPPQASPASSVPPAWATPQGQAPVADDLHAEPTSPVFSSEATYTSPIIVPSTVGPQDTPGSELAPLGPPNTDGPGWAHHRDLAVNAEQRLVLVGGHDLALTRTEFDLLTTLMESKRRVRSKADLTLVLRGESYVTSYFVGDADKRAIEAHMTNLRRKLGDNPNNPRYIETVRGVGHRLTSETAA